MSSNSLFGIADLDEAVRRSLIGVNPIDDNIEVEDGQQTYIEDQFYIEDDEYQSEVEDDQQTDIEELVPMYSQVAINQEIDYLFSCGFRHEALDLEANQHLLLQFLDGAEEFVRRRRMGDLDISEYFISYQVPRMFFGVDYFSEKEKFWFGENAHYVVRILQRIQSVVLGELGLDFHLSAYTFFKDAILKMQDDETRALEDRVRTMHSQFPGGQAFNLFVAAASTHPLVEFQPSGLVNITHQKATNDEIEYQKKICLLSSVAADLKTNEQILLKFLEGSDVFLEQRGTGSVPALRDFISRQVNAMYLSEKELLSTKELEWLEEYAEYVVRILQRIQCKKYDFERSEYFPVSQFFARNFFTAAKMKKLEFHMVAISIETAKMHSIRRANGEA